MCSRDGHEWELRGTALAARANSADAWDAYCARITCVWAAPGCMMACYDGTRDVKGNYEERCGLAVSADGLRFERVSIAAPALVSPHASGALRYVDVAVVGGQWHFFYEAACADGSHELRTVVRPF